MNIKLEQVRALADANRLKVVMALLDHEDLCACQIIEWLGVSGATISRHLGQLRQAGLVQAEKEGRWVHFSLAPDFPVDLRTWLMPGLEPAERARLNAILEHTPSELCRKQRTPVS
jgi:ArsR family transcriptional regulator